MSVISELGGTREHRMSSVDVKARGMQYDNSGVWPIGISVEQGKCVGPSLDSKAAKLHC